MEIEFWPFRINSTGFDFLLVMLVIEELEDPYPIGKIELGYFVFKKEDSF